MFQWLKVNGEELGMDTVEREGEGRLVEVNVEEVEEGEWMTGRGRGTTQDRGVEKGRITGTKGRSKG